MIKLNYFENSFRKLFSFSMIVISFLLPFNILNANIKYINQQQVDPDKEEAFVTFVNKSEFIPDGKSNPQFRIGQKFTLNLNYSTGTKDGKSNDLNFIATRLRQLDDKGNIVQTSVFNTPIGNDAENKGNKMVAFEIPEYFDTEERIAVPALWNLPEGHKMQLLIVMSTDNSSTSTEKSPVLVDGSVIVDVLAPVSDEIVVEEDSFVTFVNKSEFIPDGKSNPQFRIGQKITLNLDYNTGTTEGKPKDLNFIATRLRQLDDKGNILHTSVFNTPIKDDADNKGSKTVTFEIPGYFDTEEKIPVPVQSNLPSGHKMQLLIVMSTNNSPTSTETSSVLVNGSVIVDILAPINARSNKTRSINDKRVKISPNPASNYFNIKGANFEKWEIFNLNGKKVRFGNNNRVDVTELAKGLYILKIDGNQTLKLIKN